MQLALLDQPLERLDHQLLALVDVVEDLVAEDEVAAVDPDVGVGAGAHALRPRRPSSNSTRWKVSGGRTARKQPVLPLAPEASIISGSGASRQPVAVVGEEHLLVLDVLAHGAAGAGRCCARCPVSTSVTRQSGGCSPSISTLRAGVRDDAVGVGLLAPVQEEFLDGVGLVAEAEHEIAMPVLAVVLHHVPQDRLLRRPAPSAWGCSRSSRGCACRGRRRTVRPS